MSLSWVFSFSDREFNITSVVNIMYLWGHILSGFADKELAYVSTSKPQYSDLKIITLQGYWRRILDSGFNEIISVLFVVITRLFTMKKFRIINLQFDNNWNSVTIWK